MLKANPRLKLTIFAFAYLFLLTAGGGGGGGGSIPDKDSTAPSISSKVPDNREIDVTIFEPITVTFNENINTATNESNVVLLKYKTSNPNNFDENLQAVDRIKVTVTPKNNKLIIDVVPGISSGFVEYTADSRYKLILLNIEDSVSNPMAETSWEFATTTIPEIKNILPLMNDAVSRATDITIIFSEAMEQSSVETGFSLQDLGPISAATPPAPIKVTGITSTYNKSTNTATFTLPDSTPLLNANSKYKISLSNMKDLKGNIAPAVTSTFKTNIATSDTLLKTQPSNVIATAHSNRVDIKWTAAPLISGVSEILYNVYGSIDNIAYDLLTITGPITALNYSDSAAMDGNTYYYAVTAVANSIESKKVFNNNGAVTPQALLNFAANEKPTTALGNESVTISWTSLAGAKSYNIYVKVDNAGTFTLLNKNPVSTSLNNFVHNKNTTNLVSSSLAIVGGSSYAYKIAAINGNNEEGAKSAASLLAKPVALPEIVSFTPSPADILVTQSSTLTAKFANGKGIITSTGNPDIILGTASSVAQTFTTTVTPGSTTSYTLTVTNSNNVSATPITKQVTVSDPGKISFKVLSTDVAEADTTIMLKVIRTNGDRSVSVDYQTTTGGSATAGSDYVAVTTPKTITFLANSLTAEIPITIKNDTVKDSLIRESFNVKLSNATNGATLATSNLNHTVYIVDNDILSLDYGLKQLKLSWAAYPRDPAVNGAQGDVFYKLWGGVKGNIKPINISGS